MIRMFVCLFLLSIIRLPAGAQSLDQRLGPLLDSLARTTDAPGFCLAVALPDGSTHAFARGFSNVEKREVLTTAHLLPSGSIGKTYVAAVALQLVGEGRLDLDAPVWAYLGGESWFDRLPNARALTARMLLNHTSGIMEHVQDTAFLRATRERPGKIWQPVELLRYVMDRPALFPAGQGWNYADTNYILLGMVLEKITGRRFYALARERVLTPLRLHRTLAHDRRVLPGRANGYSRPGSPFGFSGPTQPNDTFVVNPQLEWTGGGFASTTADLARWGRLLYEGRAFDAGLLPQMLAGVAASRLGPGVAYGLGTIVKPSPYGTTYGHSGWFPGYVSEVRYFPEYGFTVAIQFNTDDMANIRGFDRFVLPVAGMLAGAAREMALCAIRDVTVIPMDRERVLPRQTVLIRGDRIAAMGPAAEVAIPAGATVVDGAGKYLLPGLMDMHVHFFTEQGADPSLLPLEAGLMLANGLTTARVMNGDSLYLDLRDRAARGEVAGPDLFVASPQLVGKWPFRGPFFGAVAGTADEAQAAVRRFFEKGYDALKITFFVQAGPYEAATAMAGELGLPVTGHVGPDVGLPRALAAGQQIEHYDEFLEQLLPTSAGIRRSVSGTGIWDREKAWPGVDQFDEARIPILVRAVREAGVAVTPTNFFLHSSFGYGMTLDEARRRPDYAFIPAALRAGREQTHAHFWDNAPAAGRRERFVQLRYRITRALHEAGVPLLCGSDSPEWFLVPGFSTHDELAEFVRAGLSPYAALETATRNPAAYLGILPRTGTVEIGKEADLLLISANPLDDIGNIRRIEGVFHDGAYLDRAALDRLLQSARE